MRLVELKCPSCGADLQIEEGREFCFCTYCGAKAVLDGSITTHIIDEAKIREAEAMEKIKLAELEKQQKDNSNYNKLMIIMIVVGMVGTCLMLLILHFIGIL